MNPAQNKAGSIAAILFAAVILTGALIYNGYKYNSARDPGGGAEGGSGKDYVSEAEFNQRVEAVIEAYIAKQQEKARKEQEEANKPIKVEGVSADDDAVAGAAAAPVTIIEFSDYQCPYCQRSFTEVYPKLKEKYIATGKVKYVFRDFPLNFHEPLATKEAIAAECVREQKGDQGYFQYHDLLFTNEVTAQAAEEKLQGFAKQLGAEPAKFTECLKSEKYKAEVQQDLADGQKYGVQGTPAFFINGWRLVGAQPFSKFEELIERELTAKGE